MSLARRAHEPWVKGWGWEGLYSDLSFSGMSEDRRRSHLEILVGKAGPGRGSLLAHIRDALSHVGRVVVLLSGGLLQPNPLRSWGELTHRLGLVDFGDSQDTLMNILERVDAGLELFVLCGKPVVRRSAQVEG